MYSVHVSLLTHQVNDLVDDGLVGVKLLLLTYKHTYITLCTSSYCEMYNIHYIYIFMYMLM